MVYALLFIRLFFTAQSITNTVDSPDQQKMIVVYSLDAGATGGATEVRVADKYLRLFKRERRIYLGRYGAGREVKWLDRGHVQIDGRVIDLE